MNKKQLICLWIGIVVCIYFAFTTQTSFRSFQFMQSDQYWSDYGKLIARLSTTILITFGLILTFKSKNATILEKAVNSKRGFFRITLLLSLLFITFFSIIGMVLLFKKDSQAYEPFLVGLLFAAGLWVIYIIMRWIIAPIIAWAKRGFYQDTNSGTKE